jgi:hypothetical protein
MLLVELFIRLPEIILVLLMTSLGPMDIDWTLPMPASAVPYRVTDDWANAAVPDRAMAAAIILLGFKGLSPGSMFCSSAAARVRRAWCR